MKAIKGKTCLNEGRDRVYRSSDNLSVFYKRDPFSTLDNYWFAIRQCIYQYPSRTDINNERFVFGKQIKLSPSYAAHSLIWKAPTRRDLPFHYLQGILFGIGKIADNDIFFESHFIGNKI